MRRIELALASEGDFLEWLTLQFATLAFNPVIIATNEDRTEIQLSPGKLFIYDTEYPPRFEMGGILEKVRRLPPVGEAQMWTPVETLGKIVVAFGQFAAKREVIMEWDKRIDFYIKHLVGKADKVFGIKILYTDSPDMFAEAEKDAADAAQGDDEQPDDGRGGEGETTNQNESLIPNKGHLTSDQAKELMKRGILSKGNHGSGEKIVDAIKPAFEDFDTKRVWDGRVKWGSTIISKHADIPKKTVRNRLKEWREKGVRSINKILMPWEYRDTD